MALLPVSFLKILMVAAMADRGVADSGAEKILVLSQVSDLPKHAHVPFKIGLDVTGMPEGGVTVGLGCQFRTPASKKAFP